MIKSHSYIRSSFFSICFLLGSTLFCTLSANEYNIIPYPQQVITHSGEFKFNKKTIVLCSFQQAEVLKLAQQFANQFAVVSGMKLTVQDIKNHPDTTNALVFQTSALSSESKEAYRLFISPKTIRINAQVGNGFFYALQTLYQLLPPAIYGQKKAAVNNWAAPCAVITDAPRFAYRGVHLDVVRHFFPIEFVKKFIDAMAIHKLNNFHWHLTDDQGWRIEIKQYPLLTKVGSQRDSTLLGYYFENNPKHFDGKPSGGFYTQKEAREIVAYAKDRYITVIPEIELPGHAMAAIAAYPYLSCTPDSVHKVATMWGIFKDVYCPKETTFTFLENVLTEVMDVFPSAYIHIGGDECPKDRWKTCPDCQALIKKLNLKDENGLQSYFVQRIEKFVNSKGRQIIGWDEILDGGLADNATVMSWRGITGGIAAAKAGHDVIMTPGTHCYFDQYQADPETEPVTIGGYLTLNKVYSFEPIPTELTAEEGKHILGAQANLWAEYMPTTQSVEHMAFPRMSALAEVLWSSKESRNWDRFRKEMPEQFERYEVLNIGASKAFYDVQVQSVITANKQVQISLVCDDPDVEVRYNTEGRDVTATDALYTAPFILDKSTQITASAFSKGLPVGKQITKSFLVSKLTGLTYTKNINNSWYDGGNVNALTDGIPGNTKVYTQWAAIGRGSDGEIKVDMQKAQTIERFSVGMLNAPALCGLLSPEIKLYGSLDGITYQLLAEKQLPIPTSGRWEMFRPELTFPKTEVRYLKLNLKSAGTCPAANQPTRLDNSMMFIDEICAW